MNKTEQQILDLINQSTGGTLWRPVRPLVAKALAQNQEVADRLTTLEQKSTSIVAAPSTPQTPTTPTFGNPRPVENLIATESPTKQQDRTFSFVSVQFTRHPRDRFFAGVKIWLTGYKGNPNPILIMDGSDSPISFLVETTHETVVVTVQSVGLNGTTTDLAKSPTAVVTLDGVTSAPPSPNIAQSKTAIGTPTTGWQFAFYFLTSLPNDVIDGYWIYRNTVHDMPTVAQRFKYVPHAITGANVYTFQDFTGTATDYYYYVSAINQSGFESPLVDAEPSGGGGSAVLTTYYPTSSSGNYSDPTKAYDNNTTTYSLGHATNMGVDLREHIWFGFGAGTGFAVDIDLKIMWSVSAGIGGGTFAMDYSLDGGSSWLPAPARVDGVSTVSLGLAQDFTLVKVRGRAEAPDLPGKTTNARQNVYEIWIEEFN
jgi:hypothetical protein